MALRWPDKDPNEVLDFKINWTGRLEGDTIATSTWFVPESIVKDSDSRDSTSTTIWLSGGTAGNADLTLTNRVVTVAGRTFDQSVNLKVVEK